MAVLEARQEKILAQLAELKEQVLSLCNVLKVSGQASETSHGIVQRREATHGAVERREPVVVEVVVKADPSKPCYAVQALARIWKDVNFDVACYTHSTVVETVPEIKVERKQRFTDCVRLSLIWKRGELISLASFINVLLILFISILWPLCRSKGKYFGNCSFNSLFDSVFFSVEDLEVMISGVKGYPLVGETNLLRYLVRRLSVSPNEDLQTPQASSDLDCIFDLSHRLNYQESPKEIQSTLSKIGDKLGKRNYLGSGDEPGIADVAAWSAIKRASIAKLPSNLVSWFKRCDSFFI